MTGTLYLIPTVLDERAPEVIPAYVHAITHKLQYFFVEEARTARRYLRATGFSGNLDDGCILPLDNDTDDATLSGYIQLLLSGNDAGLMSEAGVPAVADPGYTLVKRAQENAIRVVPLTGPSSIILALMASGLNGQQFRFHGYVPVKQPARDAYIRQMDDAAQKGITQIFIETPYRNDSLFADIKRNCRAHTMLCIARGLTGPDEKIQTKAVGAWDAQTVIGKIPAIFLLGS